MAKRSEESRRAILDAALHLLLHEEMTLQSLSVEAIAREAGVGKTTIYRWWPSKAAVVIDAFMENHLGHTPVASGLSVRETLRRHLRALVREYAGPPGRLVVQIIAQSQYDPAAREMFRERFFEDRYRTIEGLVRLGMEAGELPATVDPGLCAEMIYAPVYQRLLLGHRSLDRRLADALIDQAFTLWAPDAESGTDDAGNASPHSRARRSGGASSRTRA